MRRVPVPLLLVCGGLLLGFVPGLPHVELAPDLVLVANLRPISLLAFGLVIATTCGVAVVAHEVVPDLSWGSAFTLGAIVSPTDALAATEVARRLNLPRRIVSILEGESLVNDGTALVLYKFAVARSEEHTSELQSRF